VEGGIGGGACGCGAAGVAAAGACGDAGVWAGFRLHPASTIKAAPAAKIMATETLMTKRDLVQAAHNYEGRGQGSITLTNGLSKQGV
jgi:hypothetical protein